MQKSVAILAFASPLVKPWDADTVKTGIGGSEEAIIYATSVLAACGNYNVTVFANPPERKEKDNNPRVRYLSANLWGNTKGTAKKKSVLYDYIICWRRQDFAVAAQQLNKARGGKIFYWPHDAPGSVSEADSKWHDPFLNGGIFYLSLYQKHLFETRFPGWISKPNVICGNGIIVSEPKLPFDELIKAKEPCRTSCVYISNWARGLEILLAIWPAVKTQIPTATLDIYYGTETWGLFSPIKIQQIVQTIKDMASLNVQNHGMVGHDQLDQALIQASVLAYPCNCYAETYCISVVKAQWRGVIPVVPKMGALAETVKPNAPTIPSLTCNQDVSNYQTLLIHTLNRLQKAEPSELATERLGYVEFASTKTWNACVNQWLTLF